MERTWSVAGVYGVWKLTVALCPDPEEDYRFEPDEERLVLRQFSSLDPHFMVVVNFVETRSISELERSGARITQWG